ncbi:MAG: TonB-dependent receptor [Bacteroidales bacterium]|nr:TonB-dependent receptor [Bacteroidales bacterium]
MKGSIKLLLVSLFAVASMAQAFAATPVKGKITDANGEPIIGAAVMEVGTTNGVVADVDGTYTISVAGSNSVLQFSCIGYTTVEETVGSRAVIDVVLEESASFLQEAVAIGYGTQKKADVTSSVQSIKSDAFNAGAVTDAGQLIQGKVAGLSINLPSGDPTASSAVSLRGTSSLLGTSDPLVLVDGIPGSLSTVAPEDIESIDVLKDGSATAIYGTRGTNGVIIITTKNAKREMPATVEYNGYVSASTWLKTPDFLDAKALTDLRAQGYNFVGARGEFLDAQGNNAEKATDWLKEISRTAISHNHNLSIMGGTKHNTYTANISYNDRQGTIKNTGSQTIRARALVSQYLFDDMLKLSAEVMADETKRDSRFDANYVYRQACIHSPLEPVYDEDGMYTKRDIYFYQNPLSIINEQLGESRSRNVRFNGIAELKPIEQLTLKALYVRKGQNSIGGYYNTRKDESTTKDGRNGQAGRNASEYISNMLELSASYVQDFGKHHITAVAGYSYEDHTSERFSASTYDFPSDAYTWNKLEMGDAINRGQASISSYKQETKLIGLFARATYNYDDRYLLMASIRRDGSSKFGSDRHWGNFPGVSAGWRINNEGFMKDIKWLDNLKLRAGFGITGIDVTSPYQSLQSLDYSGSYRYNGTWIKTLSPVRNDNAELHWEKKFEYNVGLDFAVLDERLSGSIDFYQRDTKDALYWYSVPVPPYQYGKIMANGAHIQNRGVEVLINATPVLTKNFSWDMAITGSYNKNVLVSLSSDTYKSDSDYFYEGYISEPVQKYSHIVKVGWPLGNIYNLKSIGVDNKGKWVVERIRKDDNGVPVSKYYDLAENASEADYQVLGNGVPRYNLGWTNNFRYKGFDLAITMRGAFGFQILNMQKLFYGTSYSSFQYNVLKSAYDLHEAVDSRTGEKTGEKTPITDVQRAVSYFVENGDYWKIDNLTLGYNYKFKENKFIKRIRVYGTVNNLATITKYSGLDPEVPSIGYTAGTDERDKYPTVRSYTFGLNLTF